MTGRRRLALGAGLAVCLLLGTTWLALRLTTRALPATPAYPVRVLGEELLLATASPARGVSLCQEFAVERVEQARSEIQAGHPRVALELADSAQGWLDEELRRLARGGNLHGAPTSQDAGTIQLEVNRVTAVAVAHGQHGFGN